ncbi:MAG: hypothetical protein CO127_04870 [Ignavibacteria bacterium CG_4_9_14_3_um_filter_36_18]|nr:hypothetical protein [Ignavibacteria bacterium]PJB01240.1 MAG: hypothetical protein CO127_04870 [Ignavibacteria bacterium CG_4_9_14_3_um_filter_36_18]
MKNLLVVILSVTVLFGLISCSDDTNPNIRIRNEQSDKTNVQLQTTGGNTININDVIAGQTTEYRTVAEGNVTATAVIQSVSVSPSATFFAAMNTRYTIVILSGTIPSLRVEEE